MRTNFGTWPSRIAVYQWPDSTDFCLRSMPPPIPDEGEDVGYTGMALAEKLLSRRLGLTWEHSLITEDSLWLIGITEVEPQANDLTRAITIIAEYIYREGQENG